MENSSKWIWPKTCAARHLYLPEHFRWGVFHIRFVIYSWSTALRHLSFSRYWVTWCFLHTNFILCDEVSCAFKSFFKNQFL